MLNKLDEISKYLENLKKVLIFLGNTQKIHKRTYGYKCPNIANKVTTIHCILEYAKYGVCKNRLFTKRRNVSKDLDIPYINRANEVFGRINRVHFKFKEHKRIFTTRDNVNFNRATMASYILAHRDIRVGDVVKHKEYPDVVFKVHHMIADVVLLKHTNSEICYLVATPQQIKKE